MNMLGQVVIIKSHLPFLNDLSLTIHIWLDPKVTHRISGISMKLCSWVKVAIAMSERLNTNIKYKGSTTLPINLSIICITCCVFAYNMKSHAKALQIFENRKAQQSM